MKLNYSVVLRTLGYGGEKYQALLDSIKSQTIQPIEFVVVIPPEYELPKERLGTETFIRGPKGMVRQRVDGINAAKGDYLLIVDDDVSFPPTFVENLWQLMRRVGADAVSPKVIDDAAPASVSRVHKFFAFLVRGARSCRKQSSYALRVSHMGGTVRLSEMHGDRVYFTQTGHGGCCFINRGSAKRLRYEDELWLEKDVRYAYPDDLVFFYKAYLIGLQTVYAHTVPFTHLNSRSSMATMGSIAKKRMSLKHDVCRNDVVFWHRFQYSLLKGNVAVRCLSALGMLWKMLFNVGMHIAHYGWRPSHWGCIAACIRGYRDGFSYLASVEYKEKQLSLEKQLVRECSCTNHTGV